MPSWAAVTPDGDPVPAGGVVLVPIIAEFEPVLGSDMEDVPAARDPRPAVAVFARRGRQWAATGRLVFNMNIQTVAAKITP